ncbi:XF1762 family protein [Plantactinospora alkalitolerans]|uniref:XF1762 family protein n=1 Tax=Plantactinospora alkalitolerans TaxID=2789879 RepID=UPI001E2D5C93|nr:XF1762 family protein [Plantactinospora alkalitolerans]
MSLRTVPVTFGQACNFIEDWHRHHRPPRGHKFSVGVARDDILVGVAVVGRPVARKLDDGLTLPATTDIRTCGMLPVGRPQWRVRLRFGDQLVWSIGTL